jgi:hypothetical protein
MPVQEIIRSHPQPTRVDLDAVADCVNNCFRCAVVCAVCADACLAEADLQTLIRCVRVNLDCADVCDTTGRLLARQTASDATLVRDALVLCAVACRTCAEECERHAEHHEHCMTCAQECRRCEQACEDLLSSIA